MVEDYRKVYALSDAAFRTFHFQRQQAAAKQMVAVSVGQTQDESRVNASESVFEWEMLAEVGKQELCGLSFRSIFRSRAEVNMSSPGYSIASLELWS